MTTFPADQAAIITGGSQGLGLATAEEMIESGLTRIVIVGRDPAKGAAAVGHLESLGAETVFTAADLGEAGAPARILSDAEGRFGSIGALVNAAASTDRDSVWNTTAEIFDRMFAVNVRAPYLLIQGVARNMRSSGIAGSIVNVGSVSGHVGAPFITSYSASKAALIALTRNLANTLAEHRIRLNIVNPGWMNTPAENVIQREYHGATDGWLEEAGARQPFGRLIEPREVARLIAFLASPASGLMTGAVIDFDQHVVGAEPASGRELAE